MTIEGYEQDEVDLTFTQAELDMLYYAGLFLFGHPETERWEPSEDGQRTLLKAVKKIKEHNDRLAVNGEPDIVEAL